MIYPWDAQLVFSVDTCCIVQNLPSLISALQTFDDPQFHILLKETRTNFSFFLYKFLQLGFTNCFSYLGHLLLLREHQYNFHSGTFVSSFTSLITINRDLDYGNLVETSTHNERITLQYYYYMKLNILMGSSTINQQISICSEVMRSLLIMKVVVVMEVILTTFFLLIFK